MHIFNFFENEMVDIVQWVPFFVPRRKEGNVLFNDALNTFYLH